MDKKELSKIRIALLGHGDFARPSFRKVEKHFQIAAPQKAQAYLVANYGRIIPLDEIKKLEFGAINIHGSLLPKYRGASPIQTAIASGEKTTGVTIILIDKQVDHGPILAQKEIRIDPDDTATQLNEKLGKLAARIIIPTLNNYFSQKILLKTQDNSQSSFTKKVTFPIVMKPDENQQKLYNHYRAFSKEPGFFVNLNGKGFLKIIEAKLEKGKFSPVIVQRPGKKPLPYRIFLQGFRGKAPFCN